MDHHDFIIAGGGAGGLSLAYHLARSPLGGRSILIIDKDAKNQNDHTWCFLIKGTLLFDEIAYRTWNQIEFAGDDFHKIIDLETYQYRMIRGVYFYRFTRAALQTRPNVEFLQGSVERVVDTDGKARVVVNGQTYTADWVFGSLFAPGEFKPDATRYHYQKQHFKGWVIETSLQVMYRRGDLMKPIFTRLFKRNPVRRMFRYLDGQGPGVKISSSWQRYRQPPL